MPSDEVVEWNLNLRQILPSKKSPFTELETESYAGRSVSGTLPGSLQLSMQYY